MDLSFTLYRDYGKFMVNKCGHEKGIPGSWDVSSFCPKERTYSPPMVIGDAVGAAVDYLRQQLCIAHTRLITHQVINIIVIKKYVSHRFFLETK